MSFLAPQNIWFSVVGLLLGGVAGYFVGVGVEGGELLWPITLAGAVGGLILGGVVRVNGRRGGAAA